MLSTTADDAYAAWNKFGLLRGEKHNGKHQRPAVGRTVQLT